MTTSKASKNAISHGAYSKEIVLPWENEQQFNDLHESFREDLFPDGASEEAAVFDLAVLHWKKRRLNVGSQLAFRRSPDASALADAGRDGWDGIADYLASSVQNAETVRESLRDLAKTHCGSSAGFAKLFLEQVEMLAPDVAPSGTPSPTATNQASAPSNDQLERLNFLANQMRRWSREIAPVLSNIENYDLDERLCERAYRPEILEREMKISAEIDKRIDKTMARLVLLKEYKRAYRPKETKALPAEVITLPAKGQARELRGSLALPSSGDDAEPATLSAT